MTNPPEHFQPIVKQPSNQLRNSGRTTSSIKKSENILILNQHQPSETTIPIPVPDHSSGSINYLQNPLTTGRSAGYDPRYPTGQYKYTNDAESESSGESSYGV